MNFIEHFLYAYIVKYIFEILNKLTAIKLPGKSAVGASIIRLKHKAQKEALQN